MTNNDTSGVQLPPPMIYLACILLGIAVDFLWPLGLLGPALQYAVGLPVIALSFVLFGLVLREFSTSSTSIDHQNPTTEIITSGPFGYSRNPVYVSMTLLQIGIALALNNLWIFLMVIPAMLITERFVIRKEEAYLERKFGDDYLRYADTVRRWI